MTIAILFGLFGIAQFTAHAQSNNDTLRVAAFSSDVPAVETFSPAFDPDSYVVITQIFDTLVYQDLDGNFQPQLATSWERLTPTKWAFDLRKDVKFHNGEPFDGEAVKFTYEMSIDPKVGAGTGYILSSFSHVEVDPNDKYRVYIHTKYPDGMFLHRFTMYGSVAPPKYIAEVGLNGFAAHPIGTGPYKFAKWEKGKFIELHKNTEYWDTDIPRIDKIRFDVLPEAEWVKAFLDGKIDFIPNLAGSDTTKLMKQAKGNAKILKRETLASYWVHLRNKGLLADVNVRKALNYALDKNALVRFADFGNAIPLSSLGKKGEFGANPSLNAYPYDPKKAKEMLKEAGASSLKISAIVADIAEPIARVMKQNYAKIGVELDLEIVPRAQLAKIVTGQKITTGTPVDYDLIIWMADNPIYNLAFHAGVFLHSSGPWSNLEDQKFDELYDQALKSVESDIHRKRLEDLDTYIHDNALMIFTTQRIMTAALSRNLDIPKFALSGHLNYITLTTAQFEN